MSDDVSVGCLSMSSCRCHVPVESLEIVTLGAVQAVAEDVADGVGLGVLDGVSELEVLASAEAPAGSTVSCPLWEGPQALSARPAVSGRDGIGG